MKCPDCKSDLQPVDCRGIEVDECVNCKGRWFDRGELRKAKDKQDEDIRWLDFDPFGEDAEQLSIPSEGKICPKCLVKMSSLKFATSNIVIDKCSSCKGVWLDSHEFERIIKYLLDLMLAKPASEYAKDTFRQFIEIFTGQEGVISEIKDFLAVLYLLQLRVAVENPKVAEAAQKIYQHTPFK